MCFGLPIKPQDMCRALQEAVDVTKAYLWGSGFSHGVMISSVEKTEMKAAGLSSIMALTFENWSGNK